jgi:hypothetical protein
VRLLVSCPKGEAETLDATGIVNVSRAIEGWRAYATSRGGRLVQVTTDCHEFRDHDEVLIAVLRVVT